MSVSERDASGGQSNLRNRIIFSKHLCMYTCFKVRLDSDVPRKA